MEAWLALRECGLDDEVLPFEVTTHAEFDTGEGLRRKCHIKPVVLLFIAGFSNLDAFRLLKDVNIALNLHSVPDHGSWFRKGFGSHVSKTNWDPKLESLSHRTKTWQPGASSCPWCKVSLWAQPRCTLRATGKAPRKFECASDPSVPVRFATSCARCDTQYWCDSATLSCLLGEGYRACSSTVSQRWAKDSKVQCFIDESGA